MPGIGADATSTNGLVAHVGEVDSLFEAGTLDRRQAKALSIRYRTTNWSAYNDALRRRDPLSVLFDPDTVWPDGKTGRRGCPGHTANVSSQA